MNIEVPGNKHKTFVLLITRVENSHPNLMGSFSLLITRVENSHPNLMGSFSLLCLVALVDLLTPNPPGNCTQVPGYTPILLGSYSVNKF